MFMGEYAHTVDAKGRVIMPAKFREELGATFVVTRGLEGCLSVYTQEAWTHFAESVKNCRLPKKMCALLNGFSSAALPNWNLISRDAF